MLLGRTRVSNSIITPKRLLARVCTCRGIIGKVAEILRTYVGVNEIFDKLFEVADSKSLKNELEQTKRMNFIKDFSSCKVRLVNPLAFSD
jgi:hypothetical protein